MRIPDHIRRELRERLWKVGDELRWGGLTWVEKSPWYETWTKDPTIGGVLTHYMDRGQVRVYIKDTIMKGYVRSRQADPALPLRSLGVDANTPIAESFERPHGRRLADGRLIIWGPAEEWKLVVTALHERSFRASGTRPYAALLLAAVGRFHERPRREMVEDAATKLGIERVVWLP